MVTIMKLHIENLQKIEKADIDIEGITVIAGSNNSGKSTVGKVLYALFDTFYNMDKAIKDWKPNDATMVFKRYGENLDLICKKLSGVKRRKTSLAQGIQRKYSLLIASCQTEDEIWHQLNCYCKEHLMLYGLENELYNGNEEIKTWIEKIFNEMSDTMLNYDSEYAEKYGADKVFSSVFNKQFSKGQKKSEKKTDTKHTIASIEIKNNDALNGMSKNEICFSNDKTKEVKQEFSVNTRAIYVDNPRVLEQFHSISNVSDAIAKKKIEEQLSPKKETVFTPGIFNDYLFSSFEFGTNYISVHEQDSYAEDTNAEMQKMDVIIEKIENELKKLAEGSLVFSQENFAGLQFADDNYIPSFNINNLSTGVKAIALLQLILHYRVLKRKSVLILDEPEINLHPEWQVAYAKYIVLLQKELDLHIVITTHSPFFLKAIENVANEYGIWKKCHYYYAYNESGDARIECFDNDLEEIYSRLMMPLYNLLEDIQFKG